MAPEQRAVHIMCIIKCARDAVEVKVKVIEVVREIKSKTDWGRRNPQ